MSPRLLAAAVVLGASVALSACQSTSPGETTGASQEQVTLTVFAASSLSELGDALASAYARDTPGVTLTFNYAGSQDLVRQVEQGAAADVIVTADEESIAPLGIEATAVARNALVLALADGNPAGVAGVEDLAREGVRTGMCAPEVPCGRLANEALAAADVEPASATEENNVKAVLTKLTTGQVDAGFVYATDARGVLESLPLDGLPSNTYPAAVPEASEHPDAAAAFVAWLETPAAQDVLAGAGFLAPEADEDA